jgi:hypothetical protein
MRKFAKKSTYLKIVRLPAVALVGGLVIAPAPAQADNYRCPADRFCLFQHINYGGGRAVFSGDDNDLRDNHYDNNLIVHDTASSMINNTGRIIVLYRDIYKRNAVYAAARESVDSTFVNNNCNDTVSSLDFV